MRTTDKITLPLTVFYDASCELCSTEMRHLEQLDTEGRLVLVDCSPAAFDDAPYLAEQVSREAMLQAMHVRDAAGAWFSGVDAFEAIYGAVGLVAMARAWTHPLLRPLNERLYPWVVRHRYRLSRLGLPRVLGAAGRLVVAHRAARQALRAGRCAPGAACRTDNNNDR